MIEGYLSGVGLSGMRQALGIAENWTLRADNNAGDDPGVRFSLPSTKGFKSRGESIGRSRAWRPGARANGLLPCVLEGVPRRAAAA